MRRICSGFLAAVFACANLFCYGGVMAGQKNIKIAQTAYFDIIYASGSEKSAEILFEKADALFEELAEEFALPHTFRLPVVISPAQDDFNAYYSSAPFNHIVLYDTVPPESFAVFTESFLNMFRHELIHAISYNLHNTFWSGAKKVLGDTYNPALLTIPMGWAEGASVSRESSSGEGRLNSDYHKQFVRQAKIEGKFPRCSEIQGARDSYPFGQISYYFGGAFNGFLQEKYGMEKYAQFWYKCVNFQTLTYFGCFKKVYGIPIQTAWQEFYDSVEVPAVPANPADEEWCAPLFNPYSRKNRQRYGAVSSSEEGIAFYDAASSAVKYALRKQDTAPGEYALEKAKSVCSQKNVSRLDLSSDGKLIAVSYTSAAGRVPKNKIRIVQTKKRRSFTVPQEHIRDGSIFFSNGTYYLAAVQTHSQFCALNIYRLTIKESGSADGAVLVYQKKYDYGTEIFSPSGSTSGRVFFIVKDKTGYSVHSLQPHNSDEELRISLPKNGMIIRNLCANGERGGTETLSFSHTVPGSMPRLALLSVDFSGGTAAFSLAKNDSSGGIFSPVRAAEKKYAYSAQFFEAEGIFVADAEKMAFDSYVSAVSAIAPESAPDSTETAALPSAYPAQKLSSASKPFSLANYLFTGPHGTFVPLALAWSYSITNSADSLNSVWLPLGLSYVTGTPWTYPLFGFSIGYNPLTNSAALLAGISGGTSETQLLAYSASAQVEFDDDGYKQAHGKIHISSKVELTGRTYLSFVEDAQIFGGRQTLTKIPDIRDWTFGALKSQDSTQRLLFTNSTSAGIGNVKKSGNRYYDYSGFNARAVYNQSYCARLSSSFSEYTDYQNIGFDFVFRNCAFLPLTAEAYLFPSRSCFLGVYADIVLFTAELQKSTVHFPVLYANRFSVRGRYTGLFTHEMQYMDSWAVIDTPDYIKYLAAGDFYYFDEVSLTFSLALTPNIGGLARSDFQFELNAAVYCRPNPQPEQNRFSVAVCGVTVF